MDFEFEIYKGKKFSSLLKDIVINSEERTDTIQQFIEDMRLLIKTPNDALLFVPLIKEYLDVNVKNDEQLVKLAAIVQRLATNQSGGDADGAFGLTEAERKQLMDEANKIAKDLSEPINVKKAETPSST
jgi:hypothetical protein